jgi:hypothetical protein
VPLRPIFGRHRAWLGELCRIAARLLVDAHAAALPGARPGLIRCTAKCGSRRAMRRAEASSPPTCCAPMSLEKMIYDADTGTVIYRSKMHLGLKRKKHGTTH